MHDHEDVFFLCDARQLCLKRGLFILSYMMLFGVDP